MSPADYLTIPGYIFIALPDAGHYVLDKLIV